VKRRAVVIALAAGLLVGACGRGDDPRSLNNPSKSSSVTTSPTRDPNQRYRVSTTVLASRGQGPQLCLGGIADSYPPQCGGIDVAGLDWAAVPDKQSANGTTWGDATLVGTFDGDTFTLTEPPAPRAEPKQSKRPDFSPACDKPEGDPNSDSTALGDLANDPDVVAVWVTEDQKTYNVVVRPGATDRVRTAIRRSFAGLLCMVERDRPSSASLRELQARVLAESEGSPLGGVFMAYVDEQRSIVVVGCAIADDVSKAWAAEHWGDRVELSGYLEPVA
jgi:hypothetical protein